MLNRTILVGRLTKDPELKYSSNGVAICSFTIAVNRTFTNQQGEREADFPNVVCFKRTAENTANFCKKGSLVGVDGRLQTRTYKNSDDKTVYVTEVVADTVSFLEPKGNTNGQQNNSSQGQQRTNTDPFGGVDIGDSNLPF